MYLTIKHIFPLFKWLNVTIKMDSGPVLTFSVTIVLCEICNIYWINTGHILFFYLSSRSLWIFTRITSTIIHLSCYLTQSCWRWIDSFEPWFLDIIITLVDDSSFEFDLPITWAPGAAHLFNLWLADASSSFRYILTHV